MTNSTYHDPVLLHEAVDGLKVKADGIYVDVTFGGGGHSRAILQKLGPEGKLVAFDQDPDAIKNQINSDSADSIQNDPRLIFVPSNFRNLKRFLRLHRALPVDGILADLGTSSHQINTAERGFSTRFDAPLDMRMDQQGNITAADIINSWSEQKLVEIFSEYGELRGAKTLASTIVQSRKENLIETVEQLKAIARPPVRSININRYHAQLFQALRIAVNDEMGALKTFLEQSEECLKPGGRLVVIAYHSLEDRPVKRFFQKGQFSGELKKDFFGHVIRPFEPVNRKPILPSKEEILKNPRARSAKMRIGEKKAETQIQKK